MKRNLGDEPLGKNGDRNTSPRRRKDDNFSSCEAWFPVDPCLCLPEELAVVSMVMACDLSCFSHQFAVLRLVSTTWRTVVDRGICSYRGLLTATSWNPTWLVACGHALTSLTVSPAKPLVRFLLGLTRLQSLHLTESGPVYAVDSPLMKQLTQLTSLTIRLGGGYVRVDTLHALSNLTRLDLREAELVDSFDLPLLPKLTTLCLGRDGLSDVNGLQYATQLTALSMTSHFLTKQHASLLTNLTSLKSHATRVDSLLLSTMSHLRELVLPALVNGLSDAHLTHLTGLRALHLNHNREISDVGLGKLTALEKLVLCFNANITDAGLVGLSGLTSLRILGTVSGKIGDTALYELTALRELYLRDCGCVSDHCLSRLTALEYLCLYGHLTPKSKITDAGLAPLTALRMLALDCHHVTTACILSLTNLTQLSHLYNRDPSFTRDLPLLRYSARLPIIRASNPGCVCTRKRIDIVNVSKVCEYSLGKNSDTNASPRG